MLTIYKFLHNVILVIQILRGIYFMSTLNMRIPAELDQRLSNLAKQTGRTKTYYVIEVLNEHIGELEDIYLAQSAYEEFRKSGVKPVSLEDLEVKLGLED
jgi:RHH-type rel operon transcriptional repressor/antitoxin RelB